VRKLAFFGGRGEPRSKSESSLDYDPLPFFFLLPVIVNGRSEKAVAEAKEQIDQTMPGAMIEGFVGDLSTAAATETLLQRFPLADTLVNNLGIFEPSRLRIFPIRIGGGSSRSTSAICYFL